MIKVNNVSSASIPAANNVKRTSGNSGVDVKLEFDPSKIGATRQRDRNYPPTKKITENALEAALLKKFGFNATNSADMARVRQLMQTEGKSPFEAMKTTGSLVAAYNNRTGKYEIIPKVENSLYRELQGKAAEVKMQIKREKQSSAAKPTNPNELIAGKNGITNNKRAELENKLKNQASMSAPTQNKSEKGVKSITDTIEKVTGTSDPFATTEIGKQSNRLGVSGLRLGGKAMELSNYFSEKMNDELRYVAPNSVDELLNKQDQTNRETAQALQNANSAVTGEDNYIDTKARTEGYKIPVAEDLANKLMYFPEAIPNAIDSAIKGDFKDDDGSYSDKVGKIIGGLNPAGDVRDIIADGKRVWDGEKGGWIKLGATIVGAVPVGGDVAKPIIKEVGEELTEKAFKEVSGEFLEKTAKESGEKLVASGLVEQRQQFKQLFTEQRYNEYAKEVESVKMSKPELKDIPTEDLVAIKGYSSKDYQILNSALRNADETELKRLEPYIKVAESGLDQLPHYKGVVYRGVDFNKYPQVLESYKKGEVITEAGFASSSATKKASFKKDTLMIIESETGKDISFLSNYPNQKEILFKPDTKFKVLDVGVDEKTGQRRILLREIVGENLK